jgi:RNA polymerase-binding transcription factor DksA
MRENPKGKFKKRRPEEAEPKSPKWIEETEGRLCDERNKVRALLQAASPSLLTDEIDNYWQKRAIVRGVDLSKLGHQYRGALLRRLRQIDEALKKLKMGSYGLCTHCGEKICSRRLEADPAVSFCPRCQAILDGEPLPPDLRRYLNAA